MTEYTMILMNVLMFWVMLIGLSQVAVIFAERYNWVKFVPVYKLMHVIGVGGAMVTIGMLLVDAKGY